MYRETLIHGDLCYAGEGGWAFERAMYGGKIKTAISLRGDDG